VIRPGPPMPTPISLHASVSAGRFVYVIGGQTAGEAHVDAVLVAEMSTEGELGPDARRRRCRSPAPGHTAGVA
jgi:hypothetical protein